MVSTKYSSNKFYYGGIDIMFEVKDNLTQMKPFANKTEIKIANHRDDGDLRALRLKENDGKGKMFDFRTFFDLCLEHRIRSCDVCIAEDFFWTAMPLMHNCKMVRDEDGFDFFNQAVMASSWGTPAIVSHDDGKMYACYKEVDMADFPGVYLADWDLDYLNDELDKNIEYLEGNLNALQSLK